MQTPRSFLFVPANRIERFTKALNTAADAVIIDLEDAVPVELKVSAREMLKQWLLEHPEYQVLIRVNAKHTSWFAGALLHKPISKGLFHNIILK